MNKAFITGADGFIGSHLVERVVKEGYEVKALVYYNAFNSWGWLEKLPDEVMSQVEVVSGDVRDAHAMLNALEKVDIIFHLAALIGIPYSYSAPESYVDTNVKGTLNVLQAAREHSIERVLVTSTSEVYGTAQTVPIDETHPKQGQSPYSASKIGADYMAESFYRSFELPVTIVRPFNTYGPRQSARAVIPTIITQLLNEQKQIRLGVLHPTRDFVYVKDTVEGFVEIAHSAKTIGEAVNIATQHEISIGKLADVLIKKINPDVEIFTENNRIRPENSEVDRLLGDNSKLKKLTSWQPGYTIEQGLDETISWFKHTENSKNYKPQYYNV